MRRRAARPDAGAAAVEFALVSVVLFTLLFGVVQYGFYFFQATSVAALAGQVGREASLRQDCAGWQTEVARRVAGGGAGGAVEQVSLAPTDPARTGGPRRGDDETVTVRWDPTEVGVVPFPAIDFTETTVVRYERLGAAPEPTCTWTR